MKPIPLFEKGDRKLQLKALRNLIKTRVTELRNIADVLEELAKDKTLDYETTVHAANAFWTR